MWLSIAIAILLIVPPALTASQQTQSPITGDYIEDRSNRVYGCYCEWSGERVTGGREAILGWHIKSGSFRGVSLSDVAAAAVIVGESTLSAGEAPRKAILFVDNSASKAQQQAAEMLLRESYGHLFGRILSVHAVAIAFDKNAERATLRIGDLVNLELRKANPPRDALQGAIRWYDPFIPMKELTLGMTVNTRYQGAEFNEQWDWKEPGISGFYGTFELSPP